MPFFLLFFILLISPSFIEASDPTTIVVKALHDASNNEASDKTADVLRQKLSEIHSLYIVDPQKVEAVLSYYPNYGVSSENQNLEEIKNLLVRARDHYFQFAYLESKAELQRIIQIFGENLDLALSDGQTFLDSWITLALVHSALNQKEEVANDFRQVLKINPLYELDRKAFAPSILKLFANAKEALSQEATGPVSITTNPKVAEIYLNGIYQGVSPLNFPSMPEGEYHLSFKANNYNPVHQKISVKSDQKLALHPRLYWTGSTKKVAQNNQAKARHEIEEGLRIAKLLKVDKVLMVDVDANSIAARLVDSRYRASHRPIIINLSKNQGGLEENVNQLVRFITAQTKLNLLQHANTELDPDGTSDPILLGKRGRKISKAVLFGSIGALGVGGVLAILLSGGSKPPQTGSVALSFK
ncbi:MAG: hypothetical protein A2W61_00410 [Deltaproteobacteria bacterium RIFCSPLOWO2_01_44_7]|nr:MAG: hypothetical protein A2712_00170 [Deltaproteobacteria bacterium RIFCSPHIGHO2_01_FULL_43_49]OGQ15834.1 MAG: hypothetical protein A3D22_02820 [Deltaproteobacteria bacterium RIFCSPHIGHO2_02_FULL_44_53]OGQ28788.1 MAG: hypothetical protein A3D98_01150 [Deltaproteobacteria bacterium RIFCSPHIGHO2_12_FULL_44_21]OGQ32108.1 MAG: hypothetical protein A2979_03275 [Deltaproteobacteria bacterium RIFCSPLOWO2_01_FULL_45_74]OGQ43749.1 MAG: hypothetical protein A3I70_05715 [Deltaproteobacteria bacterium 